MLPPIKPIPIKDRLSILFVEKGHLDVLDGAFVVVDKTGIRTHIPIGGVACLMLEPGTRVSHAAVSLASRVGVPATALSPVVERLLASGMLAITEHEKLLPGREISRIRIGEILSTIRENRDLPKLDWGPKVSALTDRVNNSISGATGDKTLADVLD